MHKPKGVHIQIILSILMACLLALSGCASKKAALRIDPAAKAVSVAPAKTVDTATNDADPADDDLDADFDDDEITAEVKQVADPLEPINRVMFHLNDKVYFWVLKPVAKSYRFIVPTDLRLVAKNFFHNLAAPIRVTNCLLQAKGKAAAAEVGRFFINSTVGILGVADLTENNPELNPPAEDLGQTLGRYGIDNGFYIVWPLLGPSTLRDSIGRFGDTFLSPVNYVQPTTAMLGIRAYEVVNETSFRIGDYEALKEAALEPYTALRDAYIQNRRKKVAE